MKVTVVTRWSRTGIENVVGVFSDHDQAIKYCDLNDPDTTALSIVEHIVDAEVEPEDRRAIRP